MLSKIYRIIAWVCIIAHLNLIIPPFHVAHAMYSDDERIGKASTSLEKINPFNQTDLEESLTEEFRLNPRLSTINVSELWEKTTSFGSSLLQSRIIPFIMLASLIDGANPLYYFLAYCAGITLFDKLDSLQVNQVIATAHNKVPDILKETLEGVKATCRSLVPSRSPHMATALLALFPFLFHLTHAAIQSLGINGGNNIDISYENGGLVHYNNETAPFLVGIEPHQVILTILAHKLFVPQGFGEIQHLNSPHEQKVIQSIMNTEGNFILRRNSNGVSIVLKVENLKTFLFNLNFPAEAPNSYQHIFKFYKGISASESDLPLLTATRRFYHLGTYNENRQSKIILGTVLGVVVCIGIGISFFCYLYQSGLLSKNTDNAEKNNGDVVINLLDNENEPDYNTLSQELEKITDPEARQDLAWGAIQKFKRSLKDEHLFHLCNHMGKEHSCYFKTLDIQVECLGKMLQGDFGLNSLFKDLFLHKLSKVKNSERSQDITWHYIQKNEGSLREKGAGVLFDMCNLIEKTHPNFPASQAKCLMEILDQDLDAKASHELYRIMMNKELEKIENLDFRQDIIWEIASNPELDPNLVVKLCDEIKEDHPRCKDAVVKKAHLIYCDTKLESIARYNQAMRLLIKFPDDENAKAFRQAFFEQRWLGANMHKEMPPSLQNFDPKSENDLKLLDEFIQQQQEKES